MGLTWCKDRLLLLFGVFRALAETWRVLHQLELLTTWLTTDRIVDVARLRANQKYRFRLLLTLGHDCTSSTKTTTKTNKAANAARLTPLTGTEGDSEAP